MSTAVRVLVDTNIAKSCADPARHETSEACLRLIRLLESRACTVGVALTPSLESEWREHASRVFLGWWASMESRGRIYVEPDRQVRDYRRALELVGDKGVLTAMIKDAFLIEAAILHGFVIATQDDRQRSYVRNLIEVYEQLGRLQWFNPVSEQGWIDWIEAGCADNSAFVLRALDSPR